MQAPSQCFRLIDKKRVGRDRALPKHIPKTQMTVNATTVRTLELFCDKASELVLLVRCDIVTALRMAATLVNEQTKIYPEGASDKDKALLDAATYQWLKEGISEYKKQEFDNWVDSLGLKNPAELCGQLQYLSE